MVPLKTCIEANMYSVVYRVSPVTSMAQDCFVNDNITHISARAVNETFMRFKFFYYVIFVCYMSMISGACPTNDISIEFEIRSILGAL